MLSLCMSIGMCPEAMSMASKYVVSTCTAPHFSWRHLHRHIAAHGVVSESIVHAEEGAAGNSTAIIRAAAMHTASVCGQLQLHVYRR